MPLNKSGTAVEGTDYLPAAGSVTFLPNVGVVKVQIVPKANPARQSNATVTLQAVPGAGYTVGTPNSASVVIYPAGNATGTGVTGNYYNSTSTLINAGYSASLFTNLVLTRNDATIDKVWNSVSPGPGVNATYYTVRWLGQVQPQYSETYYFVTKTNDGTKLWINGQLLVDKWVQQSATEWTGAIDLRAGVLYDLKMEYFQATGNGEAHLSWYSDSQVKQIVPMERLYPASGTTAPPSVTSALTAFGFVGQPFTFTVTASNSANVATTFALGANSGALPAGLTLNASTGVISGTPTLAGHSQVALVATNQYGIGSSVLDIQIINTGNAVTREIWTTGVSGTAVSDIPLTATPSSIDNSLTTLEDNTSYADSTAERLRGYFTAPTTGNYYFWLAASNAAELWISNDSEPVNKVRRAWVMRPARPRKFGTMPVRRIRSRPGSRSSAGQKYYYEVLHNHGVGTATDNVAVAWFLDPTGTTANPIANSTGVIPGFVLAPYDYPRRPPPPAPSTPPTWRPRARPCRTAVGSANLRLSADTTQAILHFQIQRPELAAHRLSHSLRPLRDQSQPDHFRHRRYRSVPSRTEDRGRRLHLEHRSGRHALRRRCRPRHPAGKTYINIHSVNYPAGEIRGNLTLVSGSQSPRSCSPIQVTIRPDARPHDAGAAPGS